MSNNIRGNKKEFHKSKQPIELMSVNIDQIVVSDKFKHSGKGFKYFTVYPEGEIVKPLCIILPQMSRHIKYFENVGKNIAFMAKDDYVLDKYNKIWNVIKNKQNIVCDQKYLKVKVREFDGVIKTNFLGNEVPKENMHYACMTCITIDSVMRMDEKNYLQLYLEECKYRVKKIDMSTYIDAELESDLESDSEAESKSDTELVVKLKPGFNSDSE